MKKTILCLFILSLVSVFETFAQSVSFPDDAQERGYYDRSYKRYEAEPGKCVTNGTITMLDPTFLQTEIQSEASNQVAVQLVAKGSSVQWTNDEAADGLTIRFSLPDSPTGTGTKGNIDLYVNDAWVQTIALDSYWAWQYFHKTPTSAQYPDNTPGADKFPRMRFDEIHLKLADKIPAGATFKLVKADDNNAPYTIDFVELEEVPPMVGFDLIPDANKVEYTPDQGSLDLFISSNGGKTIYIPAGRYEVDNKIQINTDNTKLIGAGMWYTEIYFTASSDDGTTYPDRGININSSNVVIDGLFLNTVNNKRYYNNVSSFQVGKGLNLSAGSNSRIQNVWAEHFECGSWVAANNNLTIRDCRFRNNYADGINLSSGVSPSSGTKNSVVEHCSFRNNGDDDMAIWSSNNNSCDNNVFRYNTAENNWRASSLGFFGGKQNIAYNCVIIDPMEAGFRVTSDSPGAPFSSDGYSEFYDISVYKGGVQTANGSPGGGWGDLWGWQQGAVHLYSTTQYDLQNIKIYRIDLYDSKDDAIFIGSQDKSINNLVLNDIHINGTQRYGIFFYQPKGNGQYCQIEYNGIGAATDTNTVVPATFSFVENCEGTTIQAPDADQFKALSVNGNLVVSGCKNSSVSVYDILGRKQYQTAIVSDTATIPDLQPGIYIIKLDNYNKTVKIVLF